MIKLFRDGEYWAIPLLEVKQIIDIREFAVIVAANACG
ncbi:hypothetical protein J2S36_001268 [Arcanobacterium hippocoleae]|uniref:CheW-like domain-containing protein n=1 Tax=Arcanobacterium hippocoleae TaxID=149017 RepID=A0ABU1T3B0_9ACTO|nr:hypothetical protein [Arcanobacterium hippocoleae]